jgi:hypothetical protein
LTLKFGCKAFSLYGFISYAKNKISNSLRSFYTQVDKDDIFESLI